MKKLSLILITVFVVFSLCACTLNININTGGNPDKAANSGSITTNGNTATSGNAATNGSTTTNRNTVPTVTYTYEPSSFYGVWCAGSKSITDAENVASNLKNIGFDARVFVTTDWENLNPEMYYVVTAGVCNTKGEANQLLSAVKKSGYTDAYVKYSGKRK